MKVRLFVTGGTFDKEYDELRGVLYFRQTHVPEMLRLGRCALDLTIAYTTDRKVFGKSILDFQNTQFRLADLVAEATMAKTFINYCIEQLYKGQLDPATAAMAKLQLTELQGRVVDQCLQFHGGYGYMEEFPISRMYRDARITRIFGGSNEIMRMLIARTFGRK